MKNVYLSWFGCRCWRVFECQFKSGHLRSVLRWSQNNFEIILTAAAPQAPQANSHQAFGGTEALPMKQDYTTTTRVNSAEKPAIICVRVLYQKKLNLRSAGIRTEDDTRAIFPCDCLTERR